MDVATLTGAIVVALGKTRAACSGRRRSGSTSCAAWPTAPEIACGRCRLFDEYYDQIKSDIADLMNTGGRPAGSITAALFLKEFAGGLPWAHLDIAGTAWAEEARPYMPKGPSGVAVRTLAELAFTSREWL